MEDNKLIADMTKQGEEGCKRGRGIGVRGSLKPVHSMKERHFFNKEWCTG